MKRSTQRVLTTHNGSLPRPSELRDMLLARELGTPYDHGVFNQVLRRSVADVVKNQVEADIDVINDGEQGKFSFSSYGTHRLTGFEGEDSGSAAQPLLGERQDYPEFYATRRVQTPRRVCVGPIQWKDFSSVEQDIENLKTATKGGRAEDVFMSSASPAVFARQPNRYFPSLEAYMYALAEVMKREYKAIVDAGFVLQVDEPEIPIRRRNTYVNLSREEFAKVANLYIEALNYAVKDLPAERMRIHVCWGADEAPHDRDVELKEIVHLLLKARPAGMTIVGANGRHEHEWKVWRDVKLPDGKVIIPGVIDSTTNIIEHPELVAERIVRYASVLGRENVIGGVGCGFATSIAREQPQVDPKIAWAKLRSLSEGAALATKELWRK